MKLLLVSIMTAFLLTGCAHVFSDQASSLVDPSITFEQLKKDPKACTGKYVKLGGIIVNTKNTPQESQVEVVQFGLGSDDNPDESQPSGGRFLAVTPRYLDNMVYKKGRLVAIIGEVKGEKNMPLDEITYSYPLISITEIHVWREKATYQHNYDPYFYPYWWYDPFYWRYPVPRVRHR